MARAKWAQISRTLFSLALARPTGRYDYWRARALSLSLAGQRSRWHSAPESERRRACKKLIDLGAKMQTAAPDQLQSQAVRLITRNRINLLRSLWAPGELRICRVRSLSER